MMQPTLNPQVLHKLQAIRLKDGNDLACMLITIYLDATPALIDKLQDAIITGDAATSAQLITRLRGSSSSLGAIRFCVLCTDLELLPPTERVAILRRFGRIREEYAHLQQSFREFLRPTHALMYGT